MFDYNFIRDMSEYVKIFRGYPCPAILCDKELRVYWSNALAKSLYPHFTESDGLRRALGEFPTDELVKKVAENGSHTLTDVIPFSTIQLVFTPILRLDDMFGMVMQIFSADSLGAARAVYTASKAAEAFGGSVRSTIHNIFEEMDSLALKSDFAEASWVKANLNRISIDSYRILRVTGTLVDYAMLLNGSVEPRFEAVDVAAHLAQVEGALLSMSEAAGVPLTIERPTAPSLVYMDHKLIEIATMALLHNSFYFTRPGNRVLFRVEVGEELSTVTVSDRGVGIPKGEQADVWRPFFTGSSGSGGIGLGLPIARAVVLPHEGGIELVSEPGEGTTVTMRFPLLSSFGVASLGSVDTEFDVKNRFSRIYTGLADAGESPFRG